MEANAETIMDKVGKYVKAPAVVINTIAFCGILYIAGKYFVTWDRYDKDYEHLMNDIRALQTKMAIMERDYVTMQSIDQIQTFRLDKIEKAAEK